MFNYVQLAMMQHEKCGEQTDVKFLLRNRPMRVHICHWLIVAQKLKSLSC